MKKILALLLVSASLSLADDTDNIEYYLRYLKLVQEIEQQERNRHRPEPLPREVYEAYPDNPQLYRYLSRNPRYIPYYLGQ